MRYDMWHKYNLKSLQRISEIASLISAYTEVFLNNAFICVKPGEGPPWKRAINRGTSYSGKTRFPLESGTKGRFNTYRGLLILKHYDNAAYQEVICSDFIYK